MVHLRIVAPAESARQAVELLQASPSVATVVVLPGVARKPEGDLILCDVAPEDASVIIDDLKELNMGTAGILALTSAKSGALIGVLISVTTIPAAANIAVGSALGAWRTAGGAAAQLGVNLVAIVLAGVVTLYLQRRMYLSRRHRHLRDPIRGTAGLPVGRSRRLRGGGASPEAGSRGES